MAFYDEMAVLALDMITEFGQPVIISKTKPGEYDPETGGEAPGFTVEQTAQGIIFDFTGLEFQNNSLIKQGDKKLKIAAQGSVDNSFRIHPDPTGAGATARLVAGAIEFKAGQTAFIVNNLPYAIPLEFGHSTQAPGGMVRVTVARFQQIVLEAIRNNQV